MKTINLSKGAQVIYTNGTGSNYSGEIMDSLISGTYYVICDCDSSKELYNSGLAIGSYVHYSQIKSVIK